MRRFHPIILVFMLCPLPTLANDFDAAVQTYQEGHYQAAMQAFRGLAERGNPAAQFHLGLMYANGDGTPRDRAEAARWYRESASRGFAAAQRNLGLVYSAGDGVARDYVQAYAWINLAAAQGNTEVNRQARRDLADLQARMSGTQFLEAQHLTQTLYAQVYGD